jgi:hypothetical protein
VAVTRHAGALGAAAELFRNFGEQLGPHDLARFTAPPVAA